MKRILTQSLGILAVSAVLAFTVNALRPNGLPLTPAEANAEVSLVDENGEISIQNAALLFASSRALFLDARSDFEYANGHISGALSLPARHVEDYYPDFEKQIKGAEAIVTYCDGPKCPLSHELAEKLEAKGLTNVYVLMDGWSLWNDAKLPIKEGVEP